MRKRLNVKYFGCFLGVSVLFGTGVHFLHAFQVNRNAASLLTQASRMEEEGDFKQAADFLSRYVALTPGDTEVRARYGLLLAHEKLATSPKARVRAMLVLDQVLLGDPQRQDIRRRAAHLAMDLQRFSDAQEHLEKLLQSTPNDAELEQLLGRCHEAKRDYKKARKCFENAVKYAPKEVENYERLAYLLRSHADEVIQGSEGTKAKVLELADQTIDTMVAANEQSFKAHLARARYRKAVASPEDAGQTLKAIEKDVNRARELAADHVEALLAAAGLAQDQHDTQKARGYLQQACQRHPQDWRAYQALANLEVLEGKPEEALTCLRAGLKELPKQTDLLWSLANLLIQPGHKEEAVDVITRLGKEGVPPAELDYLDARLLFNEEKWLEAARLLERVYPLLLGLTNQQQDVFVSNLVGQTGVLLGRCYEQLGDSDRAYAAYSRVVAREPRSVPGRLGLALTQWNMGRLDDALDQYRQLMRLPDAPPTNWIDVARLLIQRNQQSEKSDWQEVDQALNQAEKLRPPLVQVGVLRAEVLANQAQRQQNTLEKEKLFDRARALLCKGYEDKQSRPIEIWATLAALDDLQGKAKSALALLDEAEQQCGDSVELRLARSRYWARHTEPEGAKSLAKLTQDLGKLNADEKDRLLRGVANAYSQRSEMAECENVWRQLATLQPNNLDSRLILFDLAAQANDEADMQRQVQDLRRIDGEDGTLWRYCEVCRLIWRADKRGDKEGLTEARALLSALALRRSNWSRLPLCEARIDDLLGNHDAALANYKRALQMGERGALATRRAVELLYQRRRYAEAQELLQKLPKQMLLSDEFRYVAPEVSLQVQDYLQARSLAEKAVSGDAKDYRQLLWLGQILSVAGEPKKAGEVFHRARDLADKVPDTWVALVLYLASTGQKEEAEAEIAKAERKLPKEQAALALAQCYEAVGDNDRAQKLYREALAAKPDDVSTLQGIASFYVRTGQLQDAQPYLRRIKDEYGGKAPQTAAWARRMLALLLALGGDYQQSRQALELLSPEKPEPSKAPGGDENENLHIKAAVLVLQKNRHEAIRILETLMERQAATPEDQFLLAQLYDVAGDWPKARKRWQSLLEQKGRNPLYLAKYARSLLRNDEVEEAERALRTLRELEPNAFPTKEIEARVLKARGKSKEAVALLQDQAQTKDANLALIAAVLEELGETSVAEEMYRKLVDQSKQAESVFVLVSFLGRQKRSRQALDLCDRAWQTCPPVVVAQASLRVLAEAPDDPAQFERVERRLHTAIQKDPETLSLLSALAFLRHLQGRYDEAEVTCRQILEKDNRNATAMNNLAWLLAFKGGQAPLQALQLVEGALQIVGPLPRLLDTRAVVYLSLGKINLAIKDLEDVLAENPEPATYFHLAQAHLLTKNRKAAGEALREAKLRGLQNNRLHPMERTVYRQLLNELGEK